MPKPLERLILEEEIKRLQRELAKLEGHDPEVSGARIEESEYLDHTPQNEGPEFLKAHASLWGKTIVVEGHTFNHLDKVRDYASKRGYKGIRVVFGGTKA